MCEVAPGLEPELGGSEWGRAGQAPCRWEFSISAWLHRGLPKSPTWSGSGPTAITALQPLPSSACGSPKPRAWKIDPLLSLFLWDSDDCPIFLDSCYLTFWLPAGFTWALCLGFSTDLHQVPLTRPITSSCFQPLF